ncbi:MULTISPECIES: hypothetical protein [unclassified Streptomyces]|uniref:hypothetical protein n=1 Tax=unclassified Streptomyces TaxID=2593676 RepID=UPI002FDBCCD5
MSVTSAARDGLRGLVYKQTGVLGRKVSVSEIMIGLRHLAERHPDELTAILTDLPADEK